jgi:ribosomal protein S18 acetylase RimI-like enzyme
LTSGYWVEALAAHDRTRFSCGEPTLDAYFQTRVSQDVRRDLTHAFVAIDVATQAVAGFYTLSAATVRLDLLPEGLSRRLPRYPEAPAALIGRLAVDTAHQGARLGNFLLLDAIARTLRSDLAVFAILVDPKNNRARAFYERFGFAPLLDDARLFLTAATARKAMAD